MPVTIKPASHGSSAWPKHSSPVASDKDLLRASCPKEFKQCQSIIQSSFFRNIGYETAIYSSENGFLRAAVDAYNRHHHLVLRPEDVWFAILTQLSHFVNQNAEAVRDIFVEHEGQKELHVYDDDGSRDFGEMAKKMTGVIEGNTKDESFREWLMPDFSTSTDTDKVVASIIMMGTLQKYFSYTAHLSCGLPSVTLLGIKADWESILVRLDRIPQLGSEPTRWYSLLKPVMTRFVAGFDSPDSEETKQFWQQIAHCSVEGSGSAYLSGWITAFCFWGCKRVGGGPNLLLDGVRYHEIELGDIPADFASVPLKVDDNGFDYQTTMVAGSVGVRVTSSGELSTSVSKGGNDDVVHDTVQPESGWWIFKKKDQ